MTDQNPDVAAVGAISDDLDDLDDLDGLDVEAWLATIEFPLPAEVVRQQAIRHWLEAAGFVEIDLRRVPERGEDCWQAIMKRGTNRECPNGLAAEAMAHRLAADLGCRIQGDANGLAWGDQIGIAFRLGVAG